MPIFNACFFVLDKKTERVVTAQCDQKMCYHCYINLNQDKDFLRSQLCEFSYKPNHNAVIIGNLIQTFKVVFRPKWPLQNRFTVHSLHATIFTQDNRFVFIHRWALESHFLEFISYKVRFKWSENKQFLPNIDLFKKLVQLKIYKNEKTQT